MIMFVLGFGLGFVGALALTPENRPKVVAWTKALPQRVITWVRKSRG
jgi:hypothetical protein